MAELKTRATSASLPAFLAAIPDPIVRQDARAIAAMMAAATKARPRMWGTGIVGFGERTLVYPSGRTLPWPLIAFAPRKNRVTLYIMDGFTEYRELLASLGKHAHGKSCLHLKRLADVHLPSLQKIVGSSVRHAKRLERKS